MASDEPEFSHDAKVVWETLTDEEKVIIQKEYPAKKKRDDLIRTIKATGVKTPILIELTGLSKAHLQRIARGSAYTLGKNVADNSGTSILIKELKNIRSDISILHKLIINTGSKE